MLFRYLFFNTPYSNDTLKLNVIVILQKVLLLTLPVTYTQNWLYKYTRVLWVLNCNVYDYSGEVVDGWIGKADNLLTCWCVVVQWRNCIFTVQEIVISLYFNKRKMCGIYWKENKIFFLFFFYVYFQRFIFLTWCYF